MLFQLRNIRRKMLGNNKVATYLLYAIGEILLVVIGILIAVSIDDWNEGRKLATKEANYYTKLLEDVIQDEQQVSRLIQETETRIQHANRLLHLLQQKELKPKSIANEMLLSISLVTYTFKPSTAAFDDLKSSGNQGLIDEEIAKSIRTYYTNMDGIIDVVDINSDQAVRLFYATDNYAAIGWPLIDFVDDAIDPALVNKQKLLKSINTDKAYLDELTSDAVYFIGSGARVKMLYEGLLEEVIEMRNILQKRINTENSK